jgi:hypothetical protein
MTDDLRDFAEFPRRWERPSTSRGSWSLKLLVGFFALMVLFFAMMSFHGGINGARRLAENGGGFFSVPLLAVTLIAALLSATAAFVAAYSAVTKKGERSILMLLPLFFGGLAMLLAVGEIVGHM